MTSLMLVLALSVADAPYDPQGRRDPFVSQRPATQRDALVQEVKLTGIVRTPKGFVAVLEDASGRSHFLKLGGRIFDGTVAAIDADGVTFRRDEGSELRMEVPR